MMSALPHSAVIRDNVSKYLGDVATHIAAQIGDLEGSGPFRAVYKTTLAIDCFLAKLPQSSRPRSRVLRGTIQRIPVLIAMGQDVPASVDLRRFLECVFWCVYFTDHHVEWGMFMSDPERNIEREISQPIRYNAHREPSFYRNYTKERFADEPSELAKLEVDRSTVHYSTLSAAAHGSSSIGKARLVPPLKAIPESDMDRFAKTYRGVTSAGAIILAAFFRRQFDALPPAHREWFDWLIGAERSKKIRSGEFGLHR